MRKKCSKTFQRCVREIRIEENVWKHKGGEPYQVSIYFEPRVFRYCPRVSEISEVIAKLYKLYGNDILEEIKYQVKERIKKQEEENKGVEENGDK